MTDFSKYINLKFKYKGRDFSGVDCYGLVKLVLTQEKNIEMPEYEYSRFWYREGKNYITDIKKDSISWEEVSLENIRPFDVMLFYSSPRKMIVNHMGIYIEEDRFIHVNESRGRRRPARWHRREQPRQEGFLDERYWRRVPAGLPAVPAR